MLALEWGIVLAVTAVAVVAHELAHAAVCHYYRVRWKPSIYWTGKIPNPAIAIELRDHTPRTLRVAALAPLALFVPAVTVALWIGPKTVLFSGEHATNALFMWCVATFPSLTDWRNAKDAGDLNDLRDVWFGDHAFHRLAEGIAE